MGFRELLGNDRLKQELGNSLQSGHISHFYLICGPEGSGRHTLARLLAAAIHCKAHDRPCGSCASCRKISSGSHPDFITVDDPEKKTVPVELIRQARADIYVRPNESDYKVYLFPRAQDMGVPGQNALLKILEEPPEYGVFLLLTDNPERLLPTVRSRCTMLRLQPLPEDTMLRALVEQFPQASAEDLRAAAVRSGGCLGQAKAWLSRGETLPPQTEELVRGFSDGDALGLIRVLTPMEKWKREQLTDALNQWLELLEGGLACRAGLPAVNNFSRELAAKCSPRKLMSAIGHLQKALEYAQQNVSPAAICAWLAQELRSFSAPGA